MALNPGDTTTHVFPLKNTVLVNPVDVDEFSAKKWRRLDETAETKYVHQLTVNCDYEHRQQQTLFQRRGAGLAMTWRR
ncbi:hypothetical protein BCR34DRAFT_385736 [Clohesyomyces aquaticus]|uniref:DUF1977 domain-containing protein n=1 Tax=Clohesyomyces aquaticus TaxID=1231657 RepID=A0A1Y1ZF44_9PLEO|nr:hypothetical protein BCR34DRAFT_385736 [Clohesyomyces aquaticus]